MIRAGLIVNPKSRRNLKTGGGRPGAPDGVLIAIPQTRAAQAEALDAFARAGVELLLIDGGDGTIREVLTEAPKHFGPSLPPIAVLPSGKTNALSLDLGAPRGWGLDEALASPRRKQRQALEVLRAGQGEPVARGFLFGAGAFVHGTAMAQKAHHLGMFDSFAVGLTLAGAAGRTLFGGPKDGWRAGETIGLGIDGAPVEDRTLFLLLASTLKRLPLRLKPFGTPSDGLKALIVDAPPRRLHAALPTVLTGASPAWLEPAGYHQHRPQSLDLTLPGGFVLDGETYPGGELTVRLGAPLEFVAP